jgi:hypothetical protein
MLPFALVAVGMALLATFAWCVWPPLTLLVLGLAATAAGLLIDWEALRGNSARTSP